VRRSLVGLVLVSIAATWSAAVGLPATAADTGNSAPQTGHIVSANPDDSTPNVMDGAVATMTQVGNLIIVGGAFNTVRNAGSTTDITRHNLFAFDATTGVVSTTFAPNPNNSVYTVQPASDGTSVYVGGNFTSVTSGGVSVAVPRLYKAAVSNGTRIAAFAPGAVDGPVRDLSVTGNRLWVAGKFAHVAGVAQGALATVNATTGAFDPYFNGAVAGSHKPGTATNVLQIATNPANNRLVAVGNFATIRGARRQQIVELDIGLPTYGIVNWYTRLYEQGCSSSFETYMTGVEYSPDGSFFVVSTTGGYGGASLSVAGNSGCDGVFRFESSALGTSDLPTWVNYTGGDTTWAVEVTDNVVYAGGHQRWQNNPTTGDAAGQGAVSREGIAALNTLNGMPYTWNPTRTRGVGVKDMIATTQGLFVGSDTDTFGGETHRKVAFLPLASGATLATVPPYTLPGNVYQVPSGKTQLLRKSFNGTQATSTANAPNGPTSWATAVGAFMINGILYTGYSNGTLTRRTFDGTTYGAAVPVDTADLLVRQTDWHNTDMHTMTSLFYDRGKIFFTRAGVNALYNRAFEPESNVVGQLRSSTAAVSGISYPALRGAFVVGNKLYYGAANKLSVADWNGRSPVAGTAHVVSTAGTGWSSRVVFLYQG
jgi:hypothetical protein